MTRPIELKIALGVLVCEYLVVLVGYITSLVSKISAATVTVPVVVSFIGFLIIRPLVLYLLWRGTSWVRTWIVWSTPLTIILLVASRMHSRPSTQGSSTSIFSGYEALRAGHPGTTIALTIGFLAFLALYSPRVAAWYRYMKESRSNTGATAV